MERTKAETETGKRKRRIITARNKLPMAKHRVHSPLRLMHRRTTVLSLYKTNSVHVVNVRKTIIATTTNHVKIMSLVNRVATRTGKRVKTTPVNSALLANHADRATMNNLNVSRKLRKMKSLLKNSICMLLTTWVLTACDENTVYHSYQSTPRMDGRRVIHSFSTCL